MWVERSWQALGVFDEEGWLDGSPGWDSLGEGRRGRGQLGALIFTVVVYLGIRVGACVPGCPGRRLSLSSSTSRQQYSAPTNSLTCPSPRLCFRPAMESTANHFVSLFICFRIGSPVVWIGPGRYCWP